MVAFAAITGSVPKAGVVVVALLVAAALLARSERARAAAIVGALGLAPTLLLADIWSSPQLRLVHRHPLLAAAAAAAALAVLGVVAAVISRRPAVLGVLAAVALPFRIPIQAGGTTSNLLVPLYLVVAAGALAFVVPALLGRRRDDAARDAEAEPAGEPPRAAWIERLLAVYIVLYAAQAIYSSDFEKALQQIVFFYVPFALLFILLRRLDWTPRLLRACFGIVVALAILFAGIGFLEYATKTIYLNPKLVVANDLHTYFTVNSVFFDPDIFGRFLALVMIGLAVGLLYDGGAWLRLSPAGRVLAVCLSLAVLWGGLVLTLSRSSLAALLVGLALLAALRWHFSRTLAIAAVVVALGAGAVAISPTTFGLNQGLNGASSGRASLISGGASLFGDRPVWGYGSGSFVKEYRAHNPGGSTTLSASHTIPITIAAEQGAIGEVAYIALVAAAALALLRGARADPARAGVAAAYIALVFHTLLYADFLEDPVTWALLAVGAALAVQRRPAPAAEAATLHAAAVPA
jgi:O-antigen ligase